MCYKQWSKCWQKQRNRSITGTLQSVYCNGNGGRHMGRRRSRLLVPGLPLISTSIAHPRTFNVLLKGHMHCVGGDCLNILAPDLLVIARQPLQYFHQVATAASHSPYPLARHAPLQMLLSMYLSSLATGSPCTTVISPKRRWS